MYLIESKDYPINEEEVIKFEKHIGSILPNEYRNFLLKYNVCTVSPKSFLFQVNGEQKDSLIDFFLGLNVHPRKEYYYSLYWYYKIMKDRVANQFLKIASDPFGNAILIHLEKGSIWFWDHELEADIEDDGEVLVDNISFISETLNSFLDTLYEMDIEGL